MGIFGKVGKKLGFGDDGYDGVEGIENLDLEPEPEPRAYKKARASSAYCSSIYHNWCN